MQAWRGAAFGAVVLVACGGATEPTEPLGPGPLEVGVAQVRMPVPVGIGTVGFGGFGIDSEPSPFAEIYPATTRVHNHPDFRAIALSRGPGHEVVFLRSDTVGIFQQLRQGVLAELEDRTGRNLDHVLVIGATHTHSGPGRVIDAGGPFSLIADEFLPEHYERMVDAMADAVELALDDLRPGRIGWAMGRDDASVSDRRCEDGGPDYVNGRLPVMAVEQEGTLTAVMMAYPIHGTVLGIEELTLSQDVSGAIEQAVEDRFDAPVLVQMFNAWGADMSPGDPDIDLGAAAEQPDGYDQMEQVGSAVADAVELALLDVQWDDEPALSLSTHRVPIDRQAIGYPDDVFTYEYGAVYCGSGLDADCLPETTLEDMDNTCIPFNEDFPAPMQTEISVGQVGAYHLVTFPGESGTALGEQIIADLEGFAEVENVLYLGYAQDYLGYAIQEEDWWQGGYEASGGLWGPRQGEYLADMSVQVFARGMGYAPDKPEPDPIEPFGGYTFTPYVGPSPLDAGTEHTALAPTEPPTDAVVTWTVHGDDPWYGTPLATLQTEAGEAVLRPNGLPVTSDGQAFWVDLAVDPPYENNEVVAERRFAWTFSLPVQHAVAEAGPGLISGQGYRLSVALPTRSGDVVTVTSDGFTAP